MPTDSQDSRQLLADAIARNCAVVVSLPTAGLLGNHKTRFLGECEQGLWVELPLGARPLVEELHANRLPVALSFHANHRRISFVTTVVRLDDAYQINTSVTVCALLVAPPKKIEAVQRRSAYRVQMPQDSDLRFRVLKIPEHAHINERPPPSEQVNVTLRDISVGGLGVTVDQEDSDHKLLNGQRLRVELTYNEIEIVLEGRLRCGSQSDNKTMQAGIIFKKLEGNVDGRQKLAAITRIVGELSRVAVRRMRRSA